MTTDHLTAGELMNYLRGLFDAPPKGRGRYFWFDGEWYKMVDGQCFIRGDGGDNWPEGPNYYPCSILEFHRLKAQNDPA